jgi:hypothetical protein
VGDDEIMCLLVGKQMAIETRSKHRKRAGRIGRIEYLFRNRISIMRICHKLYTRKS